ncbi:M48 family metalloprotease [Micromonospora sp. SH-82]|uniref:M48 family metalloprotease n=1 Tax=Micromonospora sp. SH-82 TaxID=3132938 RepID=UPI003EC06DD3
MPEQSTDKPDRRFAHRPPGYPSALVWLRAGVLRDWRGVLGAFLATWFYVPVGLLVALWSAIVLAALGLVLGVVGTTDAVPDVLLDAPLVGTLIEAFLDRSGGVLGGFVGFALGLVAGFLIVMVLPWRHASDEPANLMTGLAGMVLAALLVGVLYTLYRVIWEPRLLALTGARRLSRREADRLLPILADCARSLDLPDTPRLLIEDDPILTNARAYARHVVVTTSLLDEPDENIAALLCHELVHWRTGDEVTSAFVRGVGLPLVLIHAVPTWLTRRFPHPATDLFVFLTFWPVLLTMRYLVLPLHSRDIRAAEYRADAGAVLAGHAQGMRDMLEKRKSFESGRSGWDEAVCATHPPSELRLDMLDQVTAAPAAADRPADARSADARGAGRPVTTADLFRPSRSASPRTVVVAGVLALACGFGGTVLGAAQWAFFRPATVVDDYFSALEDRDGRAALGLMSPAVSVDADRIAEFVAAEGYQPPQDVEVTKIERDGDEATAFVAYTVFDEPITAELHLRRDETATLGLFHGWRIDATPAVLTVPGGQPEVTVNGIPVPVGPEGASLALLPGTYQLTGQQGPLTETSPQPYVVVPGQTDAGAAYLEPTVDPDAQAAAEREVRTYLDTCATEKVAAPEGCPFAYYGGGVKRIAWKIVTYPKITLELTDATSARVSTPFEAQGRIRATGTAEDYFGTPTPFTKDDPFDVRGTLTVVDGTFSFQPDDR